MCRMQDAVLLAEFIDFMEENNRIKLKTNNLDEDIGVFFWMKHAVEKKAKLKNK